MSAKAEETAKLLRNELEPGDRFIDNEDDEGEVLDVYFDTCRVRYDDLGFGKNGICQMPKVFLRKLS